MVSKLWFYLIIISIIFSLLTGNIDKINIEILSCGKLALDMIFRMLPIMALWLGIMNVSKESKLLDKLTNLLIPLLSNIFPLIPKDHESLKYISSNVVANIFGLGSAATPFGLKAMKSLQDLNDDKTKASKSMITFLILNTSGLTIIPTTIISMRMSHNSINPTSIVFACILSTFLSTILSIFVDKIFRRLK